MEDWLTQLEKVFAQATDDTERWLTLTVDTMLDTAEQLTTELEIKLDSALDGLDQIVDPWATTVTSNLITWIEEVSAPVAQVIDPILQEHPRCIGCRHYHGQSYGGQMLVCAMHPYGPDPDLAECPDLETPWPPQWRNKG